LRGLFVYYAQNQSFSFLQFNSIFSNETLLYFSRIDNKRRAAIAYRLPVLSIDGQHGNEAKVGRCCDFCLTQKGEILPWPFKPRTTQLLV
jgi:hypothetical protein